MPPSISELNLPIHWPLLAAISSAFVTALVFVFNKMREGKFKRIEYLFSLGERLDTDPELRKVIMILEGRHADISLSEIFDTSLISQKDINSYKQSFDRLFNFFERLNHAVIVTGTITLLEAQCFEWYLDKIRNNTMISKYCEDNGFSDVLLLACRMEEHNNKSYWLIENTSGPDQRS